jgi:hypothetical protein
LLPPEEDDKDEESFLSERTPEPRTELFDNDEDDGQPQDDTEDSNEEESDRSDRESYESDDFAEEDEKESSAVEEECDTSYPDVCIPTAPPDLDCRDIGGGL